MRWGGARTKSRVEREGGGWRGHKRGDGRVSSPRRPSNCLSGGGSARVRVEVRGEGAFPRGRRSSGGERVAVVVAGVGKKEHSMR